MYKVFGSIVVFVAFFRDTLRFLRDENVGINALLKFRPSWLPAAGYSLA